MRVIIIKFMIKKNHLKKKILSNSNSNKKYKIKIVHK